MVIPVFWSRIAVFLGPEPLSLCVCWFYLYVPKGAPKVPYFAAENFARQIEIVEYLARLGCNCLASSEAVVLSREDRFRLLRSYNTVVLGSRVKRCYLRWICYLKLRCTSAGIRPIIRGSQVRTWGLKGTRNLARPRSWGVQA
jgi:hypothetical protein